MRGYLIPTTLLVPDLLQNCAALVVWPPGVGGVCGGAGGVEAGIPPFPPSAPLLATVVADTRACD